MAQTHSLLKIEEIAEKGGYDIESAGTPMELLTIWSILSASLCNRLGIQTDLLVHILKELPPDFVDNYDSDIAWRIKMPMPPRKKDGTN